MVQHRLGYTTWYAHLSQITSWVGEQVSGGTRLGYVGEPELIHRDNLVLL